MNVITISGNLTREPEVRAVSSELSVVSFDIANNDNFRRDANTGKYESEVCFIKVSYFTKKPDYWINRLKKGTGVVVSGMLKQERWTAEDGTNRSTHAITLRETQWPIIEDRAKAETYGNIQTEPKDSEENIPF